MAYNTKPVRSDGHCVICVNSSVVQPRNSKSKATVSFKISKKYYPATRQGQQIIHFPKAVLIQKNLFSGEIDTYLHWFYV